MRAQVKTVIDYLDLIAEDRKEPFEKLRRTLIEHLPEGFEEMITYGMISYVVPLSLYPSGYHVSPGTPLPFINIASQKHYIALYHMGLYADPTLFNWFAGEYAAYGKLDAGKNCIRFRTPDEIPYPLIARLAEKMSVEQWIRLYEKQIGR